MRARATANRLSFTSWLIIIAIGLAVSGVVGMSYHAMTKLLYPGDRIIDGKSQREIAQVRRACMKEMYKPVELSIPSSEGIKLAGLFFERSNAKANILLCHGFRSNKETMQNYLEIFPDYNILMFDFRGHGQSQGNLISIGPIETTDVLEVTRFYKSYLKEKLPNAGRLPFIILGRSMGAAATLRATTIEPNLCDALIVDSSYSQLDKEVEHTFSYHSGLPKYPFLPIINFLVRTVHGIDMSKMRPIDYIQSVRMPLMLIHSAVDTIVPTEHTLQLYERAVNTGRDVKLWITPPCFHAHMHDLHTQLYKKKVDKFLKRTLDI